MKSYYHWSRKDGLRHRQDWGNGYIEDHTVTIDYPELLVTIALILMAVAVTIGVLGAK